MCKANTMIAKFTLLSLMSVLIFANPYKAISLEEKLNLFTTYFLNENLKSKLPKKPQKKAPKQHDYNYEPTKYELYYNYVQRIKAIEESIAQEQKKLNEEYEADIYTYNNKVKALKRFYNQEKNLYPLFTESFNKAIKVVYGKPILTLKSSKKGIEFFLDTKAIYMQNNFIPKPLEFNYADEKRMFSFYEKCDISVTFKYNDNILQYDEVICSYEDEIYQGKINSQNNEKIKLNVKINDDIFEQIKTKSSKEDNK